MEYGVDVSHYQGTDIDWNAVHKSGKVFAYLKASEGTTYVDPTFESNAVNAKKAGLAVGAYHFARFGTVEQAKAEAEHFVNTIKKADLDLPHALDIEVDQHKVGKDTLTQAAKAFLDTVKELTKHEVIFYTFISFLGNHVENTGGYPLWIARYREGNDPGVKDWTVWQNTSSGTVPGIKGRVDLDIAQDGFAVKKPAPAPKPKPVAPKANVPAPTIKYGEKGSNVKFLQECLNKVYFKCGTADGIFGPKTLDALKRFQSVYCNPVTGVYDQKTHDALAKKIK